MCVRVGLCDSNTAQKEFARKSYIDLINHSLDIVTLCCVNAYVYKFFLSFNISFFLCLQILLFCFFCCDADSTGFMKDISACPLQSVCETCILLCNALKVLPVSAMDDDVDGQMQDADDVDIIPDTPR